MSTRQFFQKRNKKETLNCIDDINGPNTVNAVVQLLDPTLNKLLRADFGDDRSPLRDFHKEKPIAITVMDKVKTECASGRDSEHFKSVVKSMASEARDYILKLYGGLLNGKLDLTALSQSSMSNFLVEKYFSHVDLYTSNATVDGTLKRADL